MEVGGHGQSPAQQKEQSLRYYQQNKLKAKELGCGSSGKVPT
jgi:hypothetical protein